MNASTTTVEVPSHLVPALNSLLAERAAAIEADAERVGETTQEPKAPRPRPVRRGVRVDAHLLAEGAAVGLDRAALQALAGEAGSCLTARAWIVFCARHLGDQRAYGYGGGGDWDLFADDICRELELADVAAAKRAAAEVPAAAKKTTEELQAAVAALEDTLLSRQAAVHQAEAALGRAKVAMQKVEQDLALTRKAVDRRNSALLQLDPAHITDVATRGDCSLGDAEATLRALRGDVGRALAWVLGPGNGPNGVLFPVNRDLV